VAAVAAIALGPGPVAAGMVGGDQPHVGFGLHAGLRDEIGTGIEIEFRDRDWLAGVIISWVLGWVGLADGLAVISGVLSVSLDRIPEKLLCTGS
jgi:hypothetical protein